MSVSFPRKNDLRSGDGDGALPHQKLVPSKVEGEERPACAYTQTGPEVTATFSALDWLARLSAHIPDLPAAPAAQAGKWEQMVRYYGGYSNRQRGGRQKAPKSPTESVPVPAPEPESDPALAGPEDTGRG